MASTGSSSKPLKFAYSFGFLGGHIHARQMTKGLRRAGFAHTKRAQDADILVAHSAGTWLLPPNAHPKLVLYVGMPLHLARPRHTWLTAHDAMRKSESPWRGLVVRSHSTYYFFRQPWRNYKIMRDAKISQPVILDAQQVVFLMNQHDPWPRDDDKLQELLTQQNWSFISLPGTHDDVWEHPDRYIDIINHYARLLAETD